MSVLWCGGEDVDFLDGVAPLMAGTNWRTGYARCALSSVSNSVLGNIFPGGAVTSCWFSCRCAKNGSVTSNKIVGLAKSGTSGMLLLTTSNSSSNVLALSKYDGSTLTQLAAESGSSISPLSFNRFDLQLINYGAHATVNVYVNSVLVITFTGDVTVPGVTSLDQVVIPPSANVNYPELSEFMVADEDLRGWPGLVTMALDGPGTTDQWTGSYNTINQVVLSDASPNYTNTALQDQQFNLTDLPSGFWLIKAVKITARAAASAGSTSTKIALGYNDGGTVAVGSAKTLTNAYAAYEEIDETNPVTSVPFVQSEMNGLQLDVRSS